MKIKAYINGKFIDAKEHVDIYSPETEKPIGSMPSLNAKQIEFAYESAYNSQPNWEARTPAQRIAILIRWAKLMVKHKEEIAKMMVVEIAKPYKDAVTEVIRSAEYVYETIKEYKNIKNEILDEKALGLKGKTAKIYHKPLGVILVIAPFNYPINLSVTKLAPALIVGNSVVFKSASNGTLSCSIITKLAHEAGVPAGVLNFVTGKGSVIGNSLIKNKYINAVMFTGGTETGINLSKSTTLAHLMFELGGKDPAIVLPDADLNKTADAIIKGAFTYSGQRCTAIKRVFVHKKIKSQLLRLLIEKVSSLSMGPAIENNYITALINKSAADFVDSLIDDAIKKGATIVTPRIRKQNLLSPVLLDNVTLQMKVAHEEQFGPVLPIISVNSIEEAIKWSNDSIYALQACIFTEDLRKAEKIAAQLIAGSVNINSQSQRGPDILPFVGVKQSGLTTQGVKYALYSVLREFNVVINK